MIGRAGKMCIYPNHQLRYVKFLCFNKMAEALLRAAAVRAVLHSEKAK